MEGLPAGALAGAEIPGYSQVKLCLEKEGPFFFQLLSSARYCEKLLVLTLFFLNFIGL